MTSDGDLDLALRLKQLHDRLTEVVPDLDARRGGGGGNLRQQGRAGDPEARPGPRHVAAGAGPHGLPVAEYGANQVKKTVVGVGHAEKNQVLAMVKILLPKADSKKADAADALAIAIAHAHHRKARALAASF